MQMVLPVINLLSAAPVLLLHVIALLPFLVLHILVVVMVVMVIILGEGNSARKNCCEKSKEANAFNECHS